MRGSEVDPRFKSREHARISVREGVLRDFYVSEYDPLSLLEDRATIVRIPDDRNNSHVTLVVLHHPFAGEHLAQFAISLAPFPHVGKSGIISDLEMPRVAKQKLKRGEQRHPTNGSADYVGLHLDHTTDPRISGPYNEFVDDHLGRIMQAFGYNTADPVFYEAQRVVFIKGKEAFLDGFFSDCEKAFETGDEENIRLIHRFATSWHDGDKGFYSFLRTKPDYTNQFHKLPMAKRNEIVKQFISQLSEEGREAFAFSIFDGNTHSLVDLETAQISEPRWSEYRGVMLPKMRFLNSESVVIQNEVGARVVITPDRDAGFGRVSSKNSDYHFPPDYYSYASYPVVAYETQVSGQQRFLKKGEADKLLRRHFGHMRWAETQLGEMLVGYLLKSVREQWEKRMQLEGRERHQEMAGAQMFAWVSLEDHIEQLFSQGKPFFSAIDDAFVAIERRSEY